ncbi:PEP-CTERM sorting domain-containing protein [Duganella sp. FT135W]|uniref:PEP-CTERM sorting domain-containing protein n=1 Tax=Duganella flavida TaxID=2692175 RepID=A0A6L8KGR5_9BURK|nr:LamG-like jellyroll fold domain-containing protein [Duganella flavida]MYM25034.1 PEP-CTERM sorting domain-containing protein [Duganella flavida]
MRKLIQIAALLAISGAAGAADHLYLLDGSAADALGGAALTSHGGTFGPTSYSFGPNQGLTLNDTLGSVYTIDMAVTFDTHSGWQKIVDFSALTSDTGMYTYGSNWNFYNVGDFGATTADGVASRLTLTRNAASVVTIYMNGSQVGTFNDAGGIANFGVNDANFFIDDYATSQREAAAGSVDYIRTYDRALDAREVASLAAPVPEPASGAMLAAGLGMLALIGGARRRKQD